MIIDSHLHVMKAINFDKEIWEDVAKMSPIDTPIEDLITWLKENGVVKAIIMGQDMSRIWNTTLGEDYVLNSYEKYKDFFIPLASLEPIDRFGRLNRKALIYFEEIIQKGFKGVLLTPPYGQYRSNDRRVYPFYELAQSKNVIVQFHHGAVPGPPLIGHLKYTNLIDLNDVNIDFPDIKIVVEHLAYPWTEMLLALMSNNPNIYTDLALLYDRPTFLAWQLVMAKEYNVLDRIMYASDYVYKHELLKDPCKKMKESIFFIKHGVNEICKKSGWPILGIDEIEGILWANANRLYDLSL